VLDFAIYKYNSIYKLLADALKFDPPQPPSHLGGEEKVPRLRNRVSFPNFTLILKIIRETRFLGWNPIQLYL